MPNDSAGRALREAATGWARNGLAPLPVADVEKSRISEMCRSVPDGHSGLGFHGGGYSLRFELAPNISRYAQPLSRGVP
jgi:hypothetical protein